MGQVQSGQSLQLALSIVSDMHMEQKTLLVHYSIYVLTIKELDSNKMNTFSIIGIGS